MPILPDSDPNDAYAVIPMPEHPHGPRGWWTVTCNGIPVHHFVPERRDLAEQYARDPDYRRSLVTHFIHDKGNGR